MRSSCFSFLSLSSLFFLKEAAQRERIKVFGRTTSSLRVMRPLVMKIIKKLDEDPAECDDEDPAECDDEKRRDWPGLVSGGIVAINFWFLQQMPALPPKVIIAWDSNHHQSLHQILGQSFLTMIFLLVLTFNLALTIALVTLLFAGQWSLKRISTYTLLINIFIIIMRNFHSQCKYELPEVIRVRLNPFPIPRNSKTDFGFWLSNWFWFSGNPGKKGMKIE